MYNKRKGLIDCFSFLLLAGMAVYAYANANVQSFWVDELSTAGYLRNGLSFGEMLINYLRVDTNLPLYSMILYPLYRLLPYGEKYLLLPSIVFCIAGIAVYAAAVRKLKGEIAGFLAIVIGVSSNTLLWQGAWEARCYALVFFLSSLTLSAYVNKSLDNSAKNRVFYGISLFLLLWSHWFACLLAAFYGLVDLLQVIAKRIGWKNLLPYLAGAAGLLPWLVIVLSNQQAELKSYWVKVPVLNSTWWTILYLLSGRRLLWYVCLITGAALTLTLLWKWIVRKEKVSFREAAGGFLTGAVGWMIGIVFLYSALINPKGSLYENRYFLILLPHVFMLTTYGVHAVLRLGNTISGKLSAAHPGIGRSCVTIITAVVVFWLGIDMVLCYRESGIAIRKPREDYRAAAEWLAADGSIWNKQTLLVGNNRYCALDGFVDYYFVKRGLREPCAVMDGSVNLPEETRFYLNYRMAGSKQILEYDRIYCLRIHMNMDKGLKKLIDRNYVLLQDGKKTGIEIWKRR